MKRVGNPRTGLDRLRTTRSTRIMSWSSIANCVDSVPHARDKAVWHTARVTRLVGCGSTVCRGCNRGQRGAGAASRRGRRSPRPREGLNKTSFAFKRRQRPASPERRAKHWLRKCLPGSSRRGRTPEEKPAFSRLVARNRPLGRDCGRFRGLSPHRGDE